ncbi:MAG: BatD family protein [Saprospiraceae bacterium]
MKVYRLIDRLQRNAPAFGSWVSVLFFLSNFHLLLAQSSPTFEASIAVKEVVVGIPFELTFTLKNAEGTRYSPPNFSGFKAGGISEMRGMSIVNGRSSTSQSWILELTATKAGSYTIGPAKVICEGRSISTNPLNINVLATASSKSKVNVPPGSDGQVFVAAEFDQKEAWVGQQLTWRIRLYTQLSVEGYDIIALPDFKGFFSKEKIRYDKRIEYINLRGKKYAVRTLHEESLFPQETGDLTVGPARVSVGIEQPGPQNFIFGPKPVSLQTEPIALKVKSLPQPAPASYSGAVGKYEWDVKADTTRLSTDDALTILIEVKGNGDSRRFAPPKIEVPPNSEIFEPRVLEEEEYESETSILHRKKFEYVVLPKDTGIQEINPVLSYFDTDSNRYCLLQSLPIRFAVSAGINFQSPNSIPLPLPVDPTVNQTPGLLERAVGWLSSPILWGILVLPFLVLGLVVFFKKRKAAPLHEKTYAPVVPNQSTEYPNNVQAANSASHQSANQRFVNAGNYLKEEDTRRFYDELFRALQAWLTTRFGMQPAQMNDADVSALLLQRGATPIRVQAFVSVWQTCEQAIYGAQAQTEQMEDVYQLARQVIEALERETVGIPGR